MRTEKKGSGSFGSRSLGSLWPSIWLLIFMGIVFVPLGLWIFSLGERYAKRSG
ncbi:MAG: hypothetical protein M3494_08540 [Actinomycetota bacterium]|jgi:hypothetical protein|nr:hypothetical protein [Rubrobacter sp.]MDQ3508046.1 hypothetical protein [Actinomycetota bacterium]